MVGTTEHELTGRRISAGISDSAPSPGFIVGVPRSGTTLLVNLVGQHPLIAPIYETRFLRNLLLLCKWGCWYCGNSPSRMLSRMLGDPLARSRFRKECERYRSKAIAYGTLLPEGDGTKQNYESFPFGESFCIKYQMEDLIRETDTWLAQIQTGPFSRDKLCKSAREYVDRLFTIHCSRMNKPHWINKTPGLLTYTGLLPLLYPQSKCIHIIRDGRDVAVSNLSLPWGPKTVREAARRWKKLILDGRKGVGIGRLSYTEFRYEDLIKQPQEVLQRTFTFLGFDGYVNEALSNVPVKKERQSVWRGAFTAEDRHAFAQEAGDLLIDLGYEIDYRWVH